MNISQNRAQFDVLQEHVLDNEDPLPDDYYPFYVVRKDLEANLLPHQLYTYHEWWFRKEVRAEARMMKE